MTAAIALLALPFLTHGRALLPGYVLSPADHLFAFSPWTGEAPAGGHPSNPVLSDVGLQLHPWLIWGAAQVAEGHFPLWNPHVLGGAPFFANPQTSLLFPLTWLTWILPTHAALTLIAILKLAAAGLAMYWCLRTLKMRPIAAFIAAVSFMFSAVMVVWLQYPLSSAILMLPILLGITERVVTHRDVRTIAGLALAVALMLCSGYPQVAVMGIVLCTGWTVVSMNRAAGRPWALARIGAGMALGAGLAAVQLLPFVEYLRESAVYAYRADWTPPFAVPARAAVLFLMPYYYGSSPGLRDFWGPFNPNEIASSVGVVPWVLLPVALMSRSRTPVWFFAIVGGLSASVLYGWPVVQPVVARTPAISLILPFRWSALLVFCLCVLAAFGLDTLLHALRDDGRAPSRMRWVIVGTFAVLAGASFISVLDDYATTIRAEVQIPIVVQYLAFVGLLGLVSVALLSVSASDRGGTRWWGGALLAVQLVSLLPMAMRYHPVLEARQLYPTTPAIEHVRRASAQDHGRVAMQGNVCMLFGLTEIAGDDAMAPRRIERLVRPGGSAGLAGQCVLDPSDVLASPALNLLGVRRIVVPPGAAIDHRHMSLEYDGPDARVYRNEAAFPRAFLVGRARCVREDEALALAIAGRVELRDEVLLTGCQVPPPAEAPGRAGAPVIVRYEPEHVVIRTSSDAASHLVLTDTWFPGWRVRVDGAPKDIWRADYALRAVSLDRGDHLIEFSYQPASVRVGAWISMVAACATVALAWRPLRRAPSAP